MRQKHLWGVLLMALLLGFSIFFMRPPGFPGESGRAPVTYLVGMSQANLVEPWRVTMNREIEKAAADEPDLRVIFTDAAQDSARQIEDVRMLMGYGIDLLVISPNESEALRPILGLEVLTPTR